MRSINQKIKTLLLTKSFAVPIAFTHIRQVQLKRFLVQIKFQAPCFTVKQIAARIKLKETKTQPNGRTGSVLGPIGPKILGSSHRFGMNHFDYSISPNQPIGGHIRSDTAKFIRIHRTFHSGTVKSTHRLAGCQRSCRFSNALSSSLCFSQIDLSVSSSIS